MTDYITNGRLNEAGKTRYAEFAKRPMALWIREELNKQNLTSTYAYIRGVLLGEHNCKSQLALSILRIAEQKLQNP